ncbi:MAG: MFS transporter, partial [Janthinobacterium lividum]
RGIILAGVVLSALGFALLAVMAGHAPLWAVLPCTFLLGVGIGATMPSVLMQVQNSAEYRDVGAATGSLLFLRSMGGAFGSTLVGSLLAARFAAGLRAAGLPGDVDLGSLRAGAGVLGPALDQARDALTSGFELSFGVCAAVMLVAAVIAAGMQDVQLRSGAAAPRDLGH